MWPKKEWKDMYESVPTGNISGMGSKNTDLRQAKAHALVRPIFRTLSPSSSHFALAFTSPRCLFRFRHRLIK